MTQPEWPVPHQDPEIEFVARQIHAKVWQGEPRRWGASVNSAYVAVAALQDYAPIATVGEDLREAADEDQTA